MTHKIPSRAQKEGVRDAYTFDTLRDYLIDLHDDKSLRSIARDEYGGKVTHAVIERIIAGYDPVDPHIRAVLGLPILAPAPVCPTCGIVHPGRCTVRKPVPEWVTRGADFLEARLREREGQ